MKNSKDSRHAISSLFAFALFALFVILMLLMVVISAQGYKRTVERGEETSSIRTALGYIEGKVLSGAARDGAEVRVIDGNDVLILSMGLDEDEPLETAIYCYDGALMEQFYGAGEMELYLESGQRLIDLEKLEMQISETDRVLHVAVQEPGGAAQSLRIALSEVWGGSE